jgi:MFS family permease
LTRRFVILWFCGWANFEALGAVSPLLPRYVKDSLGHGDVVVGLVVAAFAMSAVAVRPWAGRLANQRGRRFVTTAGAAITAGSFLLYAVPSLAVLVAARLVTGVGEALFFTGAATMVTELAPERRRGEAASYFSIAVFLGTGSGAAVGELVASHSTIAWGFVAASVLGGIATLLSLRVAETGPITPGITDEPPAKRINRVALLPGCVLALGMVANVAFASFIPLYTDQLGMSGAAGVFLLYAAIVILVRALGARVPDVLGPSLCGTIATVLIAAGMATIAASGTAWGLYLGTVAMAAGISFLYPSLLMVVVGRSTPHELSSAIATFTMFFDIAAGFGALAIGVVAAAAGYRSAFGTAAVSAIGGLAILQLLVLRPPASKREHSPHLGA